VRLSEAHDSIRDASAVCVIEDVLLANQLTDHQQPLIGMPSGRKKASAAGDQGVNTRQIPLQVAKLLLDGFANLADARPLLFGNRKKLLPSFFAVCAWFTVKGFSDLRVHRVDQDLGHLPGFIEQ
jgi:hypothetical protein